MKYRQGGYKDDEVQEERDRDRQDRPPDRPRRDPDLPGGRLAEPQRILRQLRCHHCGTSVPLEQDARGDILPITHGAACRNCQSAVHACRNCTHFDPDAHMECRKPVKVRYRKTDANDCELYEPKVVVEMTRDSSRPQGSFSPTAAVASSPKSTSSARKAFDDLFKP